MKTPIVLITDFGYKDPYVGVMKGVIKSINPAVDIIDLTHSISRHDVYEAALTLLVSAKYFPRKTIFVCVVDPGVGSERRALLIVTRNYYLIGPDNGCLTLLAGKDGVLTVYDISDSPYSLSRKSYTFHGRDLFAPVAAYLSLGYKPESLGEEIRYNDIVKLEFEKPEISGNRIKAKAIYIDVFGNIMTNIESGDIEKIGLRINDKILVASKSKSVECRFVKSFSRVSEGSYACYINSWGYFEVAINKGNASMDLGVIKGDDIILSIIK